MCCLGALALAGCGDDGQTRSNTDEVVQLIDGSQHLVLPAHERYGIYVTDDDNSGYTLSCSATDDQGRKINLNDKTPAYISTSGTETLDLVYNTGSGKLTMMCAAVGAQASTHRVTGVVR
jgi:hypothetical protein